MEKAMLLAHLMRQNDTFEETAEIIVKMIHQASIKNPGKPRVLVLSIQGHRTSTGALDHDAWELCSNFIPAAVGMYLTAFTTPLGQFKRTGPQQEDPPEEIQFGTREEVLAAAASGEVAAYDADAASYL